MPEYQSIQMPEAFHTSASMHMQDPQSVLGRAWETRNMADFKNALDRQIDPNRRDPDLNISLFEKALQTSGSSEYVSECIQRGLIKSDDFSNPKTGKALITYAIDSKDPQNLSALLKLPDIPVDVKYCKLTPLNSLAIRLTNENCDNLFECMKLLLNYGANPNIPDDQDKTTILHIVNNNKLTDMNKEQIIKYLVNNWDIDLDTYRNGQARVRIEKGFPHIKLAAPGPAQISYDSLMAILRSCNEKRFIRDFNDYQLNTSEIDNQSNTVQEQNMNLLMQAVKLGLNDAFQRILDTNLNLNVIINKNSIYEIACIWGNWWALEKLFAHDKSKEIIKKKLLITVIQKLDEPTAEIFCDFQKCFETLLKSERIDVNETDNSKSSPLHYAVKYRNDPAVRELLNRGAYIGVKSQFNDLPISDINPEILEEYFDSCVTKNDCRPGDDNFKIIMNYKNLVPVQEHNNHRSALTDVRTEMRAVQHMSDSKDLRHLLRHPLITSFLFLKWHRLSIIFYINFLAYVFFCASLVPFIILKYINVDDHICQIFHKLSMAGLLYLIVREVIQILLSPLIYIHFFVNYLEWALIILTAVLLTTYPNFEYERDRVIAVFIILLASLELCLLIGSLPIPSISTHMLMLKAVLKTFLRCFSLYSIFLLTFSLSFYILFGRAGVLNRTAGNGTTTIMEDGTLRTEIQETDDEEDLNKFVNPFTAFIKTLVMLTGEFDASSIDFQSSICSYFIFLLFVFFMTIVLLNLLNGLAVSDTQAIKSQAELNGSICRAYILSNYEKALAGRLGETGFLMRLKPFRSISKRLTNIFSDYIGGHQIAILPNSRNKILVAIQSTDEANQQKLKQNGALALLPRNNSDTNIDFDTENKFLESSVEIMPCCFACVAGRCSEMDSRTVKTALEIIQKKEKAKKKAEIKAAELKRHMDLEKMLEDTFKLLKKVYGNPV